MRAVSATMYIVWTAMPAILGTAMIQSARLGVSRNSCKRSVRGLSAEWPAVRSLVSALRTVVSVSGMLDGRRVDGQAVVGLEDRKS